MKDSPGNGQCKGVCSYIFTDESGLLVQTRADYRVTSTKITSRHWWSACQSAPSWFLLPAKLQLAMWSHDCSMNVAVKVRSLPENGMQSGDPALAN